METNIKLKVEDSAFNDVLANLSHFTNVPDSLWQMYAENRVRQIQNSISRNIMEHSKSGRFHFDRPMAVATSDNSIVRSGSYYESRIFLCNYDTAHNQDIKVYGERDFSTVKGLGHYETLAKTPGKHKLGGDIVVTAPDGEKKLYRFRTFYYAIAK